MDPTRIGEDPTGISEARGVHGCNGSSDSYGTGDCYLVGSLHRNGKSFDHSTAPVVFASTPGPTFQGDWHVVVVELRIATTPDEVGLTSASGAVPHSPLASPCVSSQR